MKKLKKYFGIVKPPLILLCLEFLSELQIIIILMFDCKVLSSFTKRENKFDLIFKSDLFWGIINIIYSLILIVASYFWMRNMVKGDDKITLSKKLPLKGILLIILLCFGISIFLDGALAFALSLLPNVSRNYKTWIDELLHGSEVYIFIQVVLIAPFLEELLIRGLVFTKARKIMPFMAANIVQAVIFGLLHVNIVQILYTALSGIIFGYIVYKYKSIYASILMHMAFNAHNYIPNIFKPTLTIYIIFISVGLIISTIALYKIKKSASLGNDNILLSEQ